MPVRGAFHQALRTGILIGAGYWLAAGFRKCSCQAGGDHEEAPLLGHAVFATIAFAWNRVECSLHCLHKPHSSNRKRACHTSEKPSSPQAQPN
jgi:hypothetical protein